MDILTEMKPQMALFTESMLKDSTSMKIDGYSFCGKARSGKGFGGVGIFVRNDVRKMTSPHETSRPIEIIWVSVRMKNEKPLFIGVYYGKQESRVNREEIEEEMDHLTDEILEMSQTGEVLLFMDGNGKIGLLGEEVSRNGRCLLDVFQECNLTVMNKEEVCTGKVTRQNRKKDTEKSAIDFVLATENVEAKINKMTIDEEGNYLLTGKTASDHNSIILDMSLDKLDQEKASKVTRWHISAPEEKWAKFRHDLMEIKEKGQAVMEDEVRTMDERYSQWTKIIGRVAFESIGKTTSKMTKTERFSSQVVQLRKERRDLKIVFESEKNHELKKEKKENYMKKQVEVRELIREERRHKLESRFHKMITEGNNLGFWREIKMARRDDCPTWMTIKDDDGNRIFDPQKIKERIATYYESLYKKQQPRVDHPYHSKVSTGMNEFTRDMNYENENYNQMPTKEEVKMAIMKKRNKKSTTDFPNEIIKRGENEMVDMIYPVLKVFWEEETPPSTWNEGLISNVWKGKGDKEKMDYQRGITVSSTIGMISEEIINSRITEIVSMSKSQGGGKKGSSTRDHVFILRGMIAYAMKHKKELFITFYDVQKAYDHVDQQDMLYVMWTHGLRGKLWQLTRNLNTNLTARVKTKHGITRLIKRESGGKQGGITMPFLFAKMMDVLAEEMEEDEDLGCKVGDFDIGCLLWVDDVVTFAEGAVQQENTLEKIDDFAVKHKLEWGASKCKVMEVGNKKVKRKVWKLGPKEIEAADSYRYLGDIISQSGNNNENLEERINKMKTITRRISSCGNTEIMKRIEVGTVIRLHEIMTEPAVLLNCETWMLNKSERLKLDRMELWAYKKLLGLPKTTPTAGIMVTLGCLFTSIKVDRRQMMYF